MADPEVGTPQRIHHAGRRGAVVLEDQRHVATRQPQTPGPARVHRHLRMQQQPRDRVLARTALDAVLHLQHAGPMQQPPSMPRRAGQMRVAVVGAVEVQLAGVDPHLHLDLPRPAPDPERAPELGLVEVSRTGIAAIGRGQLQLICRTPSGEAEVVQPFAMISQADRAWSHTFS